MKTFHLPSLLLLLTPLLKLINASVIVSESRTRLPMSLSMVVADLEAEGQTDLCTACLITSRGVTTAQRQALLNDMLGQDEHLKAESKAVATVKGLALAQPTLLEEVVTTAVACQGMLLYYPSPDDLSRQEGLLDALGPAMERLLQAQATHKQTEGDTSATPPVPSCLMVVCDASVGVEQTQKRLEEAASVILKSFHVDHVRQLSNVFGSVVYVLPNEVEQLLLGEDSVSHTTTPEDAMSAVAAAVGADNPVNMLTTSSPQLSPAAAKIGTHPQELAAARQLEPAQRAALQSANELMMTSTARNTKFVSEFGSLCHALLQQTKDNFVSPASTRQQSLLQSTVVGQQLQSQLQSQLISDWSDVHQQQLNLLQASCYADFQQSLTKLRLSPNLGQDMQRVADESVQQFQKLAKPLLLKGAASWKAHTKTVQAALTKQLQEYCADRLLIAEASGQFKPVPRKGVTIGMHWLLPKPFGNDYRQEPWMVHAADNLVYVPRRATKVTNVPADGSDWTSKVVPSPAGNDMMYLQ